MKLSLKRILEKVYDRSEMPQIRTSDFERVFSILREKGISVTKETLDPKTLKNSQKQIIKSKVMLSVNKVHSGKGIGPTIISRDNYIVDGHHRAAACKYLRIKVECFRIGLKKDNAIKLYSEIAAFLDNER